MATKPKPLHESEVLAVHERLVRAAEFAGYEFFVLDPKGERLEVLPNEPPDEGRQSALLWAIERVRPARARVLRAQGIERAADREQAIRSAQVENQCVQAGEGQKLERCLGSRRRGAPPPYQDLCDTHWTTCIRRQAETESAWQKPARPSTVNIEELVPTLDSRLRDKGAAKARTALSELLAAVDCYARHASKVESAFRALRHEELPERRAAKHLRALAQALQNVVDQTDLFDGQPDIRNASDWEAALSDVGVVLREAGCSGKEVAQWLRGSDDPDGIAAVENKVSRRRKLAR